MSKAHGLYEKYEVLRLDDDEGKHYECRYFVLDPQHDPIARVALAAYEREARAQEFDRLADDLAAWRRRLREEQDDGVAPW